jgi:hypothetical protein
MKTSKEELEQAFNRLIICDERLKKTLLDIKSQYLSAKLNTHWYRGGNATSSNWKKRR